MVQHSGITLHIVVDGKNLPEYASDYDEKTRTFSCWIPSQAGKKFYLHLQREDARRDGLAEFYLGECCGASLRLRKGVHSRSCTALEFTEGNKTLLSFSKDTEDDALFVGYLPGDFIRVEYSTVAIQNVMECYLASERYHMGDCEGPGSNRMEKTFRVNASKRLLNVVYRCRSLEILQVSGAAPAPLQLPQDTEPTPASTKRTTPDNQVNNSKSGIDPSHEQASSSEAVDVSSAIIESESKVTRLKSQLAGLIKQMLTGRMFDKDEIENVEACTSDLYIAQLELESLRAVSTRRTTKSADTKHKERYNSGLIKVEQKKLRNSCKLFRYLSLVY
ncbi:hypothetical protein CYLTODRAFT_494066 [Cylindrobasidium torrendii FP15055 ss-10]|uniref:Uncharacterized protein n=1 Tax=Cylindrobasidium torrendii FP15055 ss-10 TaxID=1314674 RepID=A0A0D7AYE5_9AGAR|nr:hypothetical protein CYLTODRAFT_494066 [Cylindrobasidium torrendii FP15055 ss-10]